ncbi:MAG: M20/M25/M40 family metallo-hydrolase [Planctomycetaceae bacterium]|nr:M20/M25/M40 family metallo-hydrolase [Planctomycetaceae bacterium]
MPNLSCRRNKSAVCLVVLAIGVLTSSSIAGDNSGEIDRLRTDVQTLASDDFEGRGVGTAGLEKAAEYVRNAFVGAGLDVTVAGGDPYQEFEITTGSQLTEPNTLAFNGANGQTIDLKYDADFRTCSFGDPGTFDAEIVFCGYGIESTDPPYNDFEAVDVKDKVVLVIRRTPQQKHENGLFAVAHGASRHASLTTKVSQAFQRGAAAVLVVNDVFTGRNEREQLESQLKEAEAEVLAAADQLVDAADVADADLAKSALETAVRHVRDVRDMLGKLNADPLIAFGYGGSRTGKSLPVFSISQAVCNQLLVESIGKSQSQIEDEIDATGKPQSVALTGWTAAGQASLKPVTVEIKNVIGVLEGEGPLADETVVIGAHYDHVGFGGEGSLAPGSTEIHNGADDNASGTAALLELARRFGERTPRLPRRLVFIAFTGEERGLLGSAEYVKEPLFALDKTVAMLNMDMVGRMDGQKLTVFGTGTSPVWDGWLDEFGGAAGLELSRKPEGLGPSDHQSFYTAKIPVLHLFSGTHSDYHRPTDDSEKINYDGMASVVELVDKLIVATATDPDRPAYVEVQGRSSMERDGSRPYFGSIPDFSADAEGYAIQGVAPGSPAAKAGLEGKDIIVRLGGHRIAGLDDFDLALRKFSAGQQVEVVVIRGGGEVTLTVTLAVPRG